MRLTAMDVRALQFKKAFRGYDVKEVDGLREMCAEAIEDAARDIMALEDRLKLAATRLEDHMANETTLKEAITTAQRMVEDLKGNARKEAELIVAEARVQADNIVKQAHTRVTQLQDDIYRLKKQRLEFEVAIKAVLDYHSKAVFLAEAEEKRADADAEKLKIFRKQDGK